MNKTAIKNFAIWARSKLISDISYRAGLMGITVEGIQNALLQSTSETEFYDIGTAEPYAISGKAVKQRRQLMEVIRRKERDSDYQTAYRYIIEEVAYTWFNRLIAIRFMEVNEYLPSRVHVLSSESGKLEPDLVSNPFDANLAFTSGEEQKIMQLRMDNQVDELFRLLFIKQCNALNEILPALFEKTNDYTELLLNLSVIDEDGVVYHLVHDISENDFNVAEEGQVEIIGWLYQYYNTEAKDETFALLKKNVKITKERIPSATQLFTPDWIVRYMVENSLGRLWVEGHPDEELKAGWKYYLEEAEQEPDVVAQLEEIRAEYRNINPDDIKIIDPCMGSGHTLVYCFDILMQIYETQGYGQRDAVQSILEHNLFGLDIDNRAAQLSYFAVMMKARQYDRRIFSRGIMPHIYAIEESNDISRGQLCYFGAGLNDVEKKTALSEITGLLDTLVDAKEYGSILNVENYNWDLLHRFIENVDVEGQVTLDTVGIEHTQEKLHLLIEIGQMMARKYDVVVTNPPYMGSGGMSSKLSDFVKKHYPDTKSDMSTVCMEKMLLMCNDNGYMAMINIPVWMFLASYEKLRNHIFSNNTIVNMVHPGRGIFGSDFGTVTFVLTNNHVVRYRGHYRRLFDMQGEEKSIGEREEAFFAGNGVFTDQQDMYSNIPGNPVAYWASSKVCDVFVNGGKFTGETKKGVLTGDNERFLRLWHEVELAKTGYTMKSHKDMISSGLKWFPVTSGGFMRKWYGNYDTVVNLENDGLDIKTTVKNYRLRENTYYFREAITWTEVSSGTFSCRYVPTGILFGNGGPVSFFHNDDLKYSLGLLNSKISMSILAYLAPTINYGPEQIKKLPFILRDKIEVEDLVGNNIALSRQDWDSFETSWDFQRHPLVALMQKTTYKNNGIPSYRVEDAFFWWNNECDTRFAQLKTNEEELNRIFIDIYGLQNELIPDVEEKDVTVRKADLERDIKSLLSYAVGCMFGRYSLDVDGLAYAGGDWDVSKYSTFIPDKDNVIPITDEEYLEDDIVDLLCTWLKKVYGADMLEENLDYIATALGNKGSTSRDIIRNYFLNDFMKDHIKVYQKRPIYWLFDSGKQNGFKALIYLHRYTPDTIGNLRIDYLHQMQRIYESEINRMQDMIDHSTNAREVATATKRKEKLQKQLKECREYDEKIAHLALSRIELDLDNGVKVNYEKAQTASDGKKYQVLTEI